MFYNLREMTMDDVPTVAAIDKASFKTPWSIESYERELRENELAIYLVVDVDGDVRGFAGMWRVMDEGHITNIAVHPEYRKMHIGSSLLIGLFDAAERNEITRLTLEVRESNVAAIRLYKKFGFVQGGIRKGYYEDNKENAIIMWADVN